MHIIKLQKRRATADDLDRNILHGLKRLGFLMKTSVFWAKLYLFLNIAFEGDTLDIAIFQHFDALSVVRNVQAFEIRLDFRDDFLIRCESLSLEPPLEVWKQIIVAGDQVWRIRWVSNQFES